MGGRRAGPIPISTSPNAITTLSNIEQGRVVDLFSSTYMSYTTNPTIYSLGRRVDGLGPISNSPIITNSIYWKSTQYTTSTLVMGGIMTGMIHISNSPFNINLCSSVSRIRMAGLLSPRSTYINISSVITRGRVPGKTWPTSTISAITWGRVAGMQEFGWYETYVHLCHHQNYKKMMIYQDYLSDGREKGWSDTYIHFS